MQSTRDNAFFMYERGELDILQKGKLLSVEKVSDIRGPIRLRLSSTGLLVNPEEGKNDTSLEPTDDVKDLPSPKKKAMKQAAVALPLSQETQPRSSKRQRHDPTPKPTPPPADKHHGNDPGVLPSE